MRVELTPEQEAFVRRAVESGRLSAPEDAVRVALDAWVERERHRDELLAATDEADQDIADGDVVELDGWWTRTPGSR